MIIELSATDWDKHLNDIRTYDLYLLNIIEKQIVEIEAKIINNRNRWRAQ